jgi:hypothetical protein
VDVLMLADGAALVSWLERTQDGAEVRARVVGRDGATGAATTIAVSDAARASGFPRMRRAGDEVWFAWTLAGGASRVHLARAPLRRR